jgi:hypothetical protein
VSAHLKPGGTASVTVEASQFKGATLQSVQVYVDVELSGGELNLGGTVDAGLDSMGLIGFKGDLELTDPFAYKRGPVSVGIQAGSMQAQVEQSTFVRARIYDLPFAAELTLPDGQIAPLTGTVSLGRLTPDEFLLQGKVYLKGQLIVWRGQKSRVIPAGDGVLALRPRYAMLRVGSGVILVPLD